MQHAASEQNPGDSFVGKSASFLPTSLATKVKDSREQFKRKLRQHFLKWNSNGEDFKGSSFFRAEANSAMTAAWQPPALQPIIGLIGRAPARIVSDRKRALWRVEKSNQTNGMAVNGACSLLACLCGCVSNFSEEQTELKDLFQAGLSLLDAD